MRFADYITLALRNISRQKLRSALTIFAIVIGATSVTIMLALVFSLKGFMTKQFEQNGTFQQVAVSKQTDITWNDQNSGGDCNNCTKLTDSLVSQIEDEQHVIGVARRAGTYFQGIQYGGMKLRSQQISAYDANGIITNEVLAGRDINNTDGDGVLTITADYANKLGYKNKYDQLVGKQINLITQNWYSGVGSNPMQRFEEQQAFYKNNPNADGRDFQPAPTTLTGTIVGITSAGFDSYTVRVSMHWMRGMLENQTVQQDQVCGRYGCQPGAPKVVVTDELAKQGYDSLIVKVDKASNAAAVAKNLRNKYKVGAADAQSEIKKQLGVFNILGAVLGGIGGIALVVAAVGVANTMIMSILERTREIGVMRAVGAKRSTVSRLFTFEAALLGFFGGAVGLGIGYGITLLANPIINDQLKSNAISSRNIITLPLWLVLGVLGITTVIGILAGLYPARRAAKLDPVEALHYE